MARIRREILFRNYDPVRRTNELLAGYKTRAAGGLPLGNVHGHVQNRLTAAYRILKALEVGIKLGRVNDPGKLDAVGASVQDKRGTRIYPAAHLAPCGIAIGTKPGGTPQELYDAFKNPIGNSFVKDIFGQTDLVHVFVNWVDTQIDRTKERDLLPKPRTPACSASEIRPTLALAPFGPLRRCSFMRLQENPREPRHETVGRSKTVSTSAQRYYDSLEVSG